MIKKLLSLALLLFLTGCSFSKKDILEIELLSDVFEVGNISSACEAVKSINDQRVTNLDIKNNIVFAEDISVRCSTTDLKELGEAVLVFDGFGQSVQKKIVIVDETAPSIHLDQDELSVEVGNEYFDLNKLISVSDNYDEDVTLQQNGAFNINEVGKYPLKLVAKDTSGNKTEKDITIVVKEKEKEIVTIVEEKIVYVDGGKPNTSTNSSTKPNSSNNTSQTKPSEPSKGQKPPSKRYMFSDGYDIESAPKACQTDLKSAYNKGWGGGCYPVEGKDGYAVGMELKIFE